jgi:FKBP-type peptidyl-prolyl cis-trans isomerase
MRRGISPLFVTGLTLALLSGCGTGSAKVKIEDLTEGTGPAAKTGDRVEVEYTGRLEDGTKFDSSRDHGKSFDFQIGGPVIKGWNQGVVGMKAGGKRKLVIPPELAYGPEGRPPVIPPNATLTFEIELLKIY